MVMRKMLATRALAAGALALGVSLGAPAETIKIGSFLAITGPASFLGDPEKKTLELYVEKINAAGGVNASSEVPRPARPWPCSRRSSERACPSSHSQVPR
jgi:hypothetical protein